MITFGKLTDLVNTKLDINEALYFIISKDETKKYILHLNRIEQIFNKGINLNNDILGFYSFNTEIITGRESYSYQGSKTKRKTQGEPYFLLDSGNLFDSFQVNVDNSGFEIQAYTIKDGRDLQKQMGEFVGLTDESQNKLVIYLIPFIRDWVLNKLLE